MSIDEYGPIIPIRYVEMVDLLLKEAVFNENAINEIFGLKALELLSIPFEIIIYRTNNELTNNLLDISHKFLETGIAQKSFQTEEDKILYLELFNRVYEWLIEVENKLNEKVFKENIFELRTYEVCGIINQMVEFGLFVNNKELLCVVLADIMDATEETIRKNLQKDKFTSDQRDKFRKLFDKMINNMKY